jgi:hypothetical protein
MRTAKVEPEENIAGKINFYALDAGAISSKTYIKFILTQFT